MIVELGSIEASAAGMYAPAHWHVWKNATTEDPALRRTGLVHTAADRADSRRLLACLGGAGNPRAHARSRCASIGSPCCSTSLSRAAGSDAAALRTIARSAVLWRFSSKHATQGVAPCSRARPQPEAEKEQRRHRRLRRLGVRATSVAGGMPHRLASLAAGRGSHLEID